MKGCEFEDSERNMNIMSGQELYGNRGIVCPDVLCADVISKYLMTDWFGRELVIMDETDSTNEVLKRNWNSYSDGTLLIARRQTFGKGRMGRVWESGEETGIWMSFMMKPQINPCNISSLTLVAAMACHEAVRQAVGIDTQIKWPNDIVFNGKKLAGILTEASFENNRVNYVIVGIGINVSVKQFPKELSDKATSFVIEGMENVDRNLLVADIGNCFEKYYNIYINKENMSDLKSEYEHNMVNLGKEVVVINSDAQFEGVARGINDSGELLIQDESGRIICVRSGEVSVRGIYGYV